MLGLQLVEDHFENASDAGNEILSQIDGHVETNGRLVVVLLAHVDDLRHTRGIANVGDQIASVELFGRPVGDARLKTLSDSRAGILEGGIVGLTVNVLFVDVVHVDILRRADAGF